MTTFSRESDDYEMSIHAMQKRRDRNVPLEAIVACIENGEERKSNGHDGVRVATKWGSIEYWAALAPEDGEVKSCGVVG